MSMHHTVTYPEALAQHPADVALVVAQVRKTRSKFKHTDPSGWIWRYTWHTSYRVCHGADLDTRITERLRQTRVTLEAKPVSRGCFSSQDISGDVDVVKAWAAEESQREISRGVALAARTPKERQADVDRVARTLQAAYGPNWILVALLLSAERGI